MKRLLIALLFSVSAAHAEPAPEKSVGFLEALSAIVDRGIDVGQQKNNVEVVAARTLKDRLSLLPTVSLKGEQGYSESYGSAQDYERNLSATAQLNLFHFGADVSAMRGASREIEAERLKVWDRELSAEQLGVLALVNVIQNEQTLDVLHRIVSIRSKLLGIADERFNKGLLARQEVDKIAVDLDNAQARERDTEIATLQARADLANLLGHDRVVTNWPWKQSLVEESKEVNFSREADLSKRPDWRAAARSLEGADARVKENFGKMLPSLDLNMSYGHFSDLTANQGGLQWSGMVTLTIPLFDRLENYGDYEARIHLKKNAELEWERTKRNAQSQWRAARDTVLTTIKSAQARERTLRTSERLYADNLQRLQQGRVSANDLVLDQDRLYDSELLAIKGWANVHSTISSWCHAQGLRLGQCGLKLD